MYHECDTTNGFQLYLIIDRISTVREKKKKKGNMGMLMCMINANPIIICPIFSYGLTFTWKTYIMLFTILWAWNSRFFVWPADSHLISAAMAVNFDNNVCLFPPPNLSCYQYTFFIHISFYIGYMYIFIFRVRLNYIRNIDAYKMIEFYMHESHTN